MGHWEGQSIMNTPGTVAGDTTILLVVYLLSVWAQGSRQCFVGMTRGEGERVYVEVLLAMQCCCC